MTTEQRLINALRALVNAYNESEDNTQKETWTMVQWEGISDNCFVPIRTPLNNAENLLAELDAQPKPTLADVKVGDEVWVKLRVTRIDPNDADYPIEVTVAPGSDEAFDFYPYREALRLD